MGDRLTQLQDAVDQLARQFLACYHYINNHHDFATFGPNDKIPDLKPGLEKEVSPLPPDEFAAGQLELAQDLIVKEQQIELLISTLPGLDNSERDQEQLIKDLEEELRAAEAQHAEAIKEKEEVQKKLDQVLRGMRRY